MANDKIFQKKRRSRQEAKARAINDRKEKRRFLIVCEGQTEATYSQFYAKPYSDLICDITHECGTSPKCVVEHAIDHAKNDNDYDHVFAIFDGDIQDEENFNCALRLIDEANSQKSNTHFYAIHSTPCFEYWLYLHFTFSRKPFKGIRNAKSAGTQILNELRKCTGMESYVKGNDLNFPAFTGKLAFAIANAKKVEEQTAGDGQRNPSTMVHHLHFAFENN